jgi:hypothetical protein
MTNDNLHVQLCIRWARRVWEEISGGFLACAFLKVARRRTPKARPRKRVRSLLGSARSEKSERRESARCIISASTVVTLALTSRIGRTRPAFHVRSAVSRFPRARFSALAARSVFSDIVARSLAELSLSRVLCATGKRK